MNLRGIFCTLRKWWWLILLCAFCAGMSGFVASAVMKPVYQASVKLMSSSNTGVVDYSSLMSGQQILATYRELLQTEPILQTAIDNLGLSDTTRELANRIEVIAVPETQLLELRVRDYDPQRAASIANEIAFIFLAQRSRQNPVVEIEEYEQTLAEQMQSLEDAIAQSEADIAELERASDEAASEELTALRSEQSQQRADYASLLSAYLNVRAMKSRLLGLVIAESAQPPTEPIRPRKAVNTAVATASGGLIGLVLAFGIDYLNDSMESAEDVRETLALPNLGVIPVINSWRGSGVEQLAATHPAADAFRVLRTNVRFACAGIDSTVRSLMLTSAIPGEGKTSVVANLAIAMAQGGASVLLVDADLRHPRLHEIFGISGHIGLAALLIDDADLENGIFDTDVESLCLMPAGTSPPNPSEILGSRRMKQLVDELSSMADIVLFDAPPTLTGADAMVLASQMDGVILVVESDSTRRQAARQALDMLCNADATILGSVLNRARTGTIEYYYSDGKEQKDPIWRRWGKMLNRYQFGRENAIAQMFEQPTPGQGDMGVGTTSGEKAD